MITYKNSFCSQGLYFQHSLGYFCLFKNATVSSLTDILCQEKMVIFQPFHSLLFAMVLIRVPFYSAEHLEINFNNSSQEKLSQIKNAENNTT